jgi:hypothetical protein
MSLKTDTTYDDAKRAALAVGMANVRRKFQEAYGDRGEDVMRRLFAFSVDDGVGGRLRERP